MCLHPELVLMEKGWLVQVAAGQEEMMKLRKKIEEEAEEGADGDEGEEE
jgi:hypothetical protein